MSAPNWNFAGAVSTTNGAEIDQCLGTHSETFVFEDLVPDFDTTTTGSSATAGFTTLNANYAYAQPIDIPAGSSYSLTKIEMPATVASGQGTPLSISIYSDNGGTKGSGSIGTSAPNASLKTITAPVEIFQHQFNGFRSKYTKLQMDHSLYTPRVSGISSNTFDNGFCYANGYLVMAGGNGSSHGATTFTDGNIYTAQIVADKMTNWVVAGTLPVALSGISLTYDSVSGYLFAIGGVDNTGTYSNVIYGATLGADGTIGSFSSVGTLYASVAYAGVVCAPGSPSLLMVMGGYNGTSTLNTGASWTISSTGTLTGYYTANLPVPLEDFQPCYDPNSNTVYIFGGTTGHTPTNLGTPLTSIYCAKLKNLSQGNIPAQYWFAGWQPSSSSLPAARTGQFTGIKDNWIIIAGGYQLIVNGGVSQYIPAAETYYMFIDDLGVTSTVTSFTTTLNTGSYSVGGGLFAGPYYPCSGVIIDYSVTSTVAEYIIRFANWNNQDGVDTSALPYGIISIPLTYTMSVSTRYWIVIAGNQDPNNDITVQYYSQASYLNSYSSQQYMGGSWASNSAFGSPVGLAVKLYGFYGSNNYAVTTKVVHTVEDGGTSNWSWWLYQDDNHTLSEIFYSTPAGAGWLDLEYGSNYKLIGTQ